MIRERFPFCCYEGGIFGSGTDHPVGFYADNLMEMARATRLHLDAMVTGDWAMDILASMTFMASALVTFGIAGVAVANAVNSTRTSFSIETQEADPITGLLVAGNVDLFNRPVIRSGQTIATVRSLSINDGKYEILIPGVSDGIGTSKILSDAEAIAQYNSTGKHLGKFDTAEHATAYALRLHEMQDDLYNNGTYMARRYSPVWNGLALQLNMDAAFVRIDLSDVIKSGILYYPKMMIIFYASGNTYTTNVMGTGIKVTSGMTISQAATGIDFYQMQAPEEVIQEPIVLGNFYFS